MWVGMIVAKVYDQVVVASINLYLSYENKKKHTIYFWFKSLGYTA